MDGQYWSDVPVICDQARRTESSLQKIRLGAQQRRGGLGSETLDNTVSETDKVCMQLLLDIQVILILKSIKLMLFP